MTKVILKQNKGTFNYFEVADHANFASYGNDVVCAAISAIVFGTLNALVHYELNENRVVVDDAFIRVDLLDDEKQQIVMQTMLIQLQTIQDTYPDYIQIQII